MERLDKQAKDELIRTFIDGEVLTALELSLALYPEDANELVTMDCTRRELDIVSQWCDTHQPGTSIREARAKFSADALDIYDRVEQRFASLLARHGHVVGSQHTAAIANC